MQVLSPDDQRQKNKTKYKKYTDKKGNVIDTSLLLWQEHNKQTYGQTGEQTYGQTGEQTFRQAGKHNQMNNLANTITRQVKSPNIKDADKRDNQANMETNTKTHKTETKIQIWYVCLSTMPSIIELTR